MKGWWHNPEHPFGSAGFALLEEVRAAGFFTQSPTGIYCGRLHDQPLFFNSDAPILLEAGPRSGKLTDILAFTICRGGYSGSAVILDVKGELAAIYQQQVAP